MPEPIMLIINGQRVSVKPGTTVAAAVIQAGVMAFRQSVSGEPRGPLCGMGICFECRLTVNGHAHVRSCQVLCEPGMDVRTDG
jgi:predicted molibdopterin-dependent oxidoreductase YjgC